LWISLSSLAKQVIKLTSGIRACLHIRLFITFSRIKHLLLLRKSSTLSSDLLLASLG
jgi:hypothetical protein